MKLLRVPLWASQQTKPCYMDSRWICERSEFNDNLIANKCVRSVILSSHSFLTVQLGRDRIALVSESAASKSTDVKFFSCGELPPWSFTLDRDLISSSHVNSDCPEILHTLPKIPAESSAEKKYAFGENIWTINMLIHDARSVQFTTST